MTKAMAKLPNVQCTSCRYCCDGCPEAISIPDVISALNTFRMYGEDNRPKFFYNGLVERSGRVSQCGRCEAVCPRHLPIIDIIKEASGKFA